MAGSRSESVIPLGLILNTLEFQQELVRDLRVV
jgi:hypothetical protein